MVDKHASPDRHGGMDIDGKDLGRAALQKMRKLSPTIAPQPMAGAVPLQRVEALVDRQQGLRAPRPRRWVAGGGAATLGSGAALWQRNVLNAS